MKTINTYYEDFENLKIFLNENHTAFHEYIPSAILVQIFAGSDDCNYLEKIASEVTRLLPHACIIGSSAGSVIMNGKVSNLKTAISFSFFYHSNVRCALLEKEEKSDFDLGVSLASSLNSNTAKVLLLFTASQLINANEVLRGISSVNPKLPVAGGKSGDPCNNIGAVLSYNGQNTKSGIVGVVLEGEHLTASGYWHLGWQPIGKAMTITKAEGLRVYTIDHIPAFEIYKKYLGLSKTGEFSNTLEYPLIVIRDGLQLARVPVIHYEDDSITFGADLQVGETVRLGFGNIKIILDGMETICTTIQQQSAESLFVYSCSCRHGYLQGLSSLETKPLQAIAPTAGFCASGEFFHSDNRNHLFNATITVLALSETSSYPCAKHPGVIPLFKNKPPSGNKAHKDTIVEKDVQVLKALTHLVNTVISELEQTQAKLQYNVIGEMAAGLSHEVRNPMTTIRGYLQVFQKKEEFSPYNKQLSVMIDELDKANLIITKFLSLSKHKRVEMRLDNINSVIHTIIPLLQVDAFQQGHEILLELTATPDFYFDDKELRQLVINLVHNGLEAMKAPGVLIIRTHYSNNHVVLSVQDSGRGIPPEIFEKLGTPFITTKDEAAGIGLPVCFRIAERHKAVININTSQQGTTIAVSFKVAHL